MIIRNINHVRELKEEEWHVTKVKTMTITSIVCFFTSYATATAALLGGILGEGGA